MSKILLIGGKNHRQDFAYCGNPVLVRGYEDYRMAISKNVPMHIVSLFGTITSP